MKISDKLLSYSLLHPRSIIVAMVVLTLGLGALIPMIQIDTDPENMLPPDQDVRVFHHEVKDHFALSDFIVVGIVNEVGEDGVYTPEILARVHKLTKHILEIDGVIARDVLSLAVVDDISPEGPGTVRFQWLMESPPADKQEARAIREAAERNPTFMGTLVSEDGKATAIYVPIRAKNESHRIATEIETMFAEFQAAGGTEEYHITGLPIAEDRFGFEMFVQMGVAAPMAMLLIFILMWLFFRSVSLITAPMILAMATVIATMGALIGCGFTVHIMSSMIPIFLMPIAVVDSVHILSEFADCYPHYRDRKAAVSHVIRHLFKPMLYTSLTSAAGFASLALAPIPPVQIFGVFVAIGILLAFVLTVTFVPAYIMLISEKGIARLGESSHAAENEGSLLSRLLERSGRFAGKNAKLILALAAVVVVVSVYGIMDIRINDNPVRWFQPGHPIRVADRVLNKHFGGTYDAFLVLRDTSATAGPLDKAAEVDAMLRQLDIPEAQDIRNAWQEILSAAGEVPQDQPDEQYEALVNGLLDAADMAASDEAYQAWEGVIDLVESSRGDDKTFMKPEVLAYIEQLQAELESTGQVGKSNSLADIVKTVNRELHERDQAHYRLPDSRGAVAQVLLTYEGSHRPHDLWHFVQPDYSAANIWLQLKSGDNQDMQTVVEGMNAWTAAHPPPPGMTVNWAGLTYLNVVWQGEMVTGMRDALLGSFVVVLIMMLLLFRSLWFGLLAMLPLSITIGFVYGMIGLMGRDYDMPIAVLSSLTLGLSVDFAIHFIQRCRSIYAEKRNWAVTLEILFAEPARAITRNAIIIALGFLPLLFSPLVPYETVGMFLAMIMIVSCVVTLILLPAIMQLLRRLLFKDNISESQL